MVVEGLVKTGYAVFSENFENFNVGKIENDQEFTYPNGASIKVITGDDVSADYAIEQKTPYFEAVLDEGESIYLDTNAALEPGKGC